MTSAMPIRVTLACIAMLAASAAYGAEATARLIESTSAQLYTVVYPKPNAESVILLHGGPGMPMDFSPIAELLSHKYQVIAFEQRGTGRSPAAGAHYAIDDYVQDIEAVARHFGLSRFHLFGHSWGGLYAQIYAENHPERLLSMFLSSPSSGTGALWKQTENEVMAFNKAHSGLWAWSMMGAKSLLGMLGSDKAYQSLFKQVLENYNQEFDPSFTATDTMVENVRAEAINKTRTHIADYPLLSDGTAYRFPIIITYGKKDIYGESRNSVIHRFPTASVVEFSNAGHIAWKQDKAAFTRTLNDFYQLPLGGAD